MVLLTKEKQERREVFLDVQNGHRVTIPPASGVYPKALLFASGTHLTELLAE